MHKGKINTNSLKTVRIEILLLDTKKSMGWASGFFFKINEKIYLISNLHVFNGKNIFTDEIINNNGAIPGFFNLDFHIIENSKTGGYHHHEAGIDNVELYNKYENEDDFNLESPKYILHPIFGKKIDVSVIELTNYFEDNLNLFLISFDIKEIDIEIDIRIMDDVFIVGYPIKSRIMPNNYPIYKSATIASEPDAFDELPIFYVDGKTKKGMSGSPVIRKKNISVIENKETLALSTERLDLIGIYSGRDKNEEDEYQAELGIVWKFKECILPFFNNC